MTGMVIIGAGECGGRAALGLREAGYEGPVTLVGEEPHLPYERPPLSKEAMVAEVAPEPKWIAPAEGYEEAGIHCLTGRSATTIDRRAHSIVLSDGMTLSYDRLLLATGSAPRRLETAGERIVYLRTYPDALAIRDRLNDRSHVILVGAGFIGMELAASARQRGAKVTVIEGMPRPLMRGVPEEIALLLSERHRQEGVKLYCASKIRTIDSGPECVKVTLEDGAEISGDFLVAAIGIAPRTTLAEQAGLAIDNGVAVDAFFATSDPDIFAAGDCCSFPLALYGGRRVRLECWQNAHDQGGFAARNMLGANTAIASVPSFWSDQYDLALQMAGLADEGTQTVRRDMSDGAFILFNLDAGGRLVAASGIGKGNAVGRDVMLCEKLIAREARPTVEQLTSPDFKLKTLLAN